MMRIKTPKMKYTMRAARRDMRPVYSCAFRLLKNQSQLAIAATTDNSPTMANIAAVIIAPMVNDIVIQRERLATDECRRH